VVKIGRSLKCEFNAPLEDLSREHCLFEIEGQNYFITDLGSSNGVTVNREKIPPHIRTPVFSDSVIVLANIYTLAINSVEIKTASDIKRLTDIKEVERETQTVSFKIELEEKPKNTLSETLLKKKTQSLVSKEKTPDHKSSMEHVKMILGFITVVGFLCYHFLSK